MQLPYEENVARYKDLVSEHKSLKNRLRVVTDEINLLKHVIKQQQEQRRIRREEGQKAPNPFETSHNNYSKILDFIDTLSKKKS